MVATGVVGTALVTVPREVSTFVRTARSEGVRDAWRQYLAGEPGVSVTELAARETVVSHLVRIAIDGAVKAGWEDGTRSARWVFDGNTSRETYQRCVTLDDDGDPQWHDQFGAREPLSGEFADDLTVRGLMAFLGVGEALRSDEPTGAETGSELCDAYVEAFHDAHRDEVLRVAHYHLGTSGLAAAREALPDAGVIEVLSIYRVKVRYPFSTVARYGEHAVHWLRVDGASWWFCETCGSHGPDDAGMGAARWHETHDEKRSGGE